MRNMNIILQKRVDEIIRRYCDVQKTYFQKVCMEELNRSYSKIVYFTTTSQGAERQMSASNRKNIHSVFLNR